MIAECTPSGGDDTALLNAFFAAVCTTRADKAFISGKFQVSGPIVIDGNATTLFEWDAEFIAQNPITTMLEFRQFRETVNLGTIGVTGVGSTTYVSRLCATGVRMVDCRGAEFGTFYVQKFQQTGVAIAPTFSNTLVTIGSIRARDCGPCSDIAARKCEATWSARVNTGSSGSVAQRTTIKVSAMPPIGTELRATMIAVINGKPHFIYGYDDVLGKITVFPWIDLTLASGSLYYMFGGAISVDGSDSGIVTLNKIDAMRCSFALMDRALYGPAVTSLVAQSCGVAYAVGDNPSAAHVSATLIGKYFEGNIFDIVRISRAPLGVNIIGTYALNMAKCSDTIEPRLSTNLMSQAYGYKSLNIVNNDELRGNWSKRGGNWTAGTLVPTMGDDEVYVRDSWVVNFPAPDMNVNRLYGQDAIRITMIGTGANGAPTGAFTFTPPAGWTVNGVASAVLSGFTGPVIFVVSYRFASHDIIARAK